LRDVRFRYTGQPQDALSGVNLVVRPGETVALVGQTGAGKSTMVKLVARYYDVTGGQPAHRRHRRAGATTWPATGSSSAWSRRSRTCSPARSGRDRLRPAGRDDAEVEAAAREVGAIEMIARLPGGFRHEVAERGRNLSAGQRQLIALARAYLADPAILLLDEATAALDLASEAAVNPRPSG
jgi:ATP-binding cassette subfamily B protein